jgi:segregation and condensation protein B
MSDGEETLVPDEPDAAIESDGTPMPDPEPDAERTPEREPDVEAEITPEIAPEPEPVQESEAPQEPEPDPVEPAPADDPHPAGPAPALRQILEALLFTSSLPIAVDRLKDLLGVDDRGEIRALVEELRIDYEATGRAFQVEEISGGYVILTRPEYGEWVGRLKGGREQFRLSRAGLETLAVVAYRQPVLRVDIEKIRGVGCGPVLRSLLEQGLVRVIGRADLPGSPLLYGTTPRFLREFGLRSVKDLPRDRDL